VKRAGAVFKAGRALLVRRTSESDTEGTFQISGETIAIQGRRARIEQRGSRWIVVWDLPLAQ
jgi:hypothetical protein